MKPASDPCGGIVDEQKNLMQPAFADHLTELKPLLSAPLNPVADDQFDRLARRLFAAQFDSVQPYRALCRSRGLTPDSLPSWLDIPPVPTSSFKEFDWTSLSAAGRTRVFHSSGTTAERPSRHFHNAASLEIYEHSLLSWARTWFLPDGPHRHDMLFLTPEPKAAPDSSLVHMFETLRRKWGTASSRFVGACDTANRWIVLQDQVRSVLAKFQSSGQPIALLGTAFSFVELMDQLTVTQTRFALPPGSRLLETGGYKSRSRALPKPLLYRQLTELLGIPSSSIVSEYGMCELSSQAYDHQVGAADPQTGRSFRFPPWARAVVINPHTNRPAQVGETGLLRVFDLANVHSVMAIQTDDLARANQDGFVLLGRATAAEARGCSLSSG
jgi:hypothetical protein